MDAAGIDVQVLSLTSPGVEQLEVAEAVAFARETNDLLAEAVRRHPDRFAGFAALPNADPEAAADELERTIREHGFKGALINGHTRDATWTTLSSGRSWSVRKRSGSRSTSTRRRPRSRWWRHPTRGTTPAGGNGPTLDRGLGDGTWRPPRTFFGSCSVERSLERDVHRLVGAEALLWFPDAAPTALLEHLVHCSGSSLCT